jgi:HK97 family phage prohead protease
MRTIAAYAALYNSRSSFLGFYETIAKGAFNGVLRGKPNVVCLFNHDDNRLLGRTTSGTQKLSADDKGLSYKCTLPQTATGDEVGELVSRGDISGSSFGFIVGEDDWNVKANGEAERTIYSFDCLTDVSPVTSPAYPGTMDAGAAVHVERSRTLSAEDAERVRRVEAAVAEARAYEDAENYRCRVRAEMAFIESGISPEKAKRMSGRVQEPNATKGLRRSFKIEGRSVTETEFVAHCKRKGIANIEQRLQTTANGRAERITVAGKVERI